MPAVKIPPDRIPLDAPIWETYVHLTATLFRRIGLGDSDSEGDISGRKHEARGNLSHTERRRATVTRLASHRIELAVVLSSN
jgi:hypothetical protein